jgi:hypothetical protein
MAHDRPIVGNYLDLQVFRPLAILPAAGAFDAAPLELDCPSFNFVTLYLSYESPVAAGAVTFQIEVSPDAAGATWYRASMYDGGALAPGVDVASNIQREAITYGGTAAALEFAVFGPLVIQAGIQRMRIACAESGDVLNPGDCEIRGFFS